MSVTRYIKANTATQVNSNLIGVQVRPGTGSISMDYIWNTVGFIIPQYDGVDISIFAPDDESLKDYAYKYTGATLYVPDGQGGGTTYVQYYRYAGVGPEEYLYTKQVPDESEAGLVVYTITSETIEEETVYTVTRWGEQKGYFRSQGSPGNTIELYSGEWLLLDNTHIYNIYDNSDQSGFRYDPDNRFVYDASDNIFTVIKDGVVGVSGVELTAELQAESDWEGKYKWTGTPVLNGSPASQYYTNVPVYTDVIDPEIGATVYYTKDNTEYNQMTVSGKGPGAVSCTVEYSVTGDTFTQVEDTLTDANNVIANVPRYVYLRFSQDVEITEE